MLIKVIVIPKLSKRPMLAVPAWGEIAKFPKLAIVVIVLRITPRAVLVCMKFIDSPPLLIWR